MFLLSKPEVLAIQRQLIDEFGGIHGIRDENVLESALHAVDNKRYYEDADLITCSATYAYHLTQAHAFIDGNKRIGAAIAEIFLEMSGASLNATNGQIVELFLNIAAGLLFPRNVCLHPCFYCCDYFLAQPPDSLLKWLDRSG